MTIESKGFKITTDYAERAKLDDIIYEFMYTFGDDIGAKEVGELMLAIFNRETDIVFCGNEIHFDYD
jgi:hypothetical protein